METDTAVEPREHLEQLRAALAEDGWPADIVGTAQRAALRVRNPDDGGLQIDVISRDGLYRWPHGRVIDGVGVDEVVAAIQHVLRGVLGS
ncbi:hypothetical protein [Nonomuraea typhae]|uniref:hypothetical protein n=1 Tax=Nonomuraea typhae TaxID=2603600 RepID=UPI0012F8955E|nr:hypothetical protein [Nonomuraea typhae]